MRDVLVFTRTKHRADRLAKFLGQQHVSVERIHGNRSQAQRTEAQRQRVQAEEAELDRILDKVRASGLQSLTRREQAALQRATDRQRHG